MTSACQKMTQGQEGVLFVNKKKQKNLVN